MILFKLEFYKKGEEDNKLNLQQAFFETPEKLYTFVIESGETIIIPEVWKDVDDYNGTYKISNHGRIRSYTKRSKGKIMTPSHSKFGYLRAELYDQEHTKKRDRKSDGKYLKNNRRTHMIHVLVATAFCPNPDPEKFDEVDHINRVSDDCPFWNLRWTDRDGNMDNRDFDRGRLENKLTDQDSNQEPDFMF